MAQQKSNEPNHLRKTTIKSTWDMGSILEAMNGNGKL